MPHLGFEVAILLLLLCRFLFPSFKGTVCNAVTALLWGGEEVVLSLGAGESLVGD